MRRVLKSAVAAFRGMPSTTQVPEQFQADLEGRETSSLSRSESYLLPRTPSTTALPSVIRLPLQTFPPISSAQGQLSAPLRLLFLTPLKIEPWKASKIKLAVNQTRIVCDQIGTSSISGQVNTPTKSSPWIVFPVTITSLLQRWRKESALLVQKNLQLLNGNFPTYSHLGFKYLKAQARLGHPGHKGRPATEKERELFSINSINSQ